MNQPAIRRHQNVPAPTSFAIWAAPISRACRTPSPVTPGAISGATITGHGADAMNRSSSDAGVGSFV